MSRPTRPSSSSVYQSGGRAGGRQATTHLDESRFAATYGSSSPRGTHNSPQRASNANRSLLATTTTMLSSSALPPPQPQRPSTARVSSSTRVGQPQHETRDHQSYSNRTTTSSNNNSSNSANSLAPRKWLALLLEQSLHFSSKGDFAAALRCLSSCRMPLPSTTLHTTEDDELHALLCCRYWINMGVYQACCGLTAEALASFGQVTVMYHSHLTGRSRQQVPVPSAQQAQLVGQWDSMAQYVDRNAKVCNRLQEEIAVYAVHATAGSGVVLGPMPKLLSHTSAELAEMFYWFRPQVQQQQQQQQQQRQESSSEKSASMENSAELQHTRPPVVRKVVEEVNLTTIALSSTSARENSLKATKEADTARDTDLLISLGVPQEQSRCLLQRRVALRQLASNEELMSSEADVVSLLADGVTLLGLCIASESKQSQSTSALHTFVDSVVRDLVSVGRRFITARGASSVAAAGIPSSKISRLVERYHKQKNYDRPVSLSQLWMSLMQDIGSTAPWSHVASVGAHTVAMSLREAVTADYHSQVYGGGCGFDTLRRANAFELLQAAESHRAQHGSGAIRLIVSRAQVTQELGSYFHSTAPLRQPSEDLLFHGVPVLSPEEVLLRPYEFVIKGETAIDGGAGGVSNEVFTLYCARMMEMMCDGPRDEQRQETLLRQFGTQWDRMLTTASNRPHPLLLQFVFATTIQRWSAFGVLLGKYFADQRSFGALQRAPLLWQQLWLGTERISGAMLAEEQTPMSRELKVKHFRTPWERCFVNESSHCRNKKWDKVIAAYALGTSFPDRFTSQFGAVATVDAAANVLWDDASAYVDPSSSPASEAHCTFSEIFSGAVDLIESFFAILLSHTNTKTRASSAASFEGLLAELWNNAERLDASWVQGLLRSLERTTDCKQWTDFALDSLCSPLLQSLLVEVLLPINAREEAAVRKRIVLFGILFDFVLGRRLLWLFAAAAGFDSVRMALFPYTPLRRLTLPLTMETSVESGSHSIQQAVASAHTVATLWSSLQGSTTLNAQTIIQRLEFVGWGREERSPLLLCHWLRLCNEDHLRGFLRWTTGCDTLPHATGSDDGAEGSINKNDGIKVVRADNDGKGPFGQTCFRMLHLPAWGEEVTAKDAEDMLNAALVSLLETDDGCRMFEM